MNSQRSICTFSAPTAVIQASWLYKRHPADKSSVAGASANAREDLSTARRRRRNANNFSRRKHPAHRHILQRQRRHQYVLLSPPPKTPQDPPIQDLELQSNQV